jgi:dolichol-phosphate mannosyltransferase
MMVPRTLISVVIPVFNESACLPRLHQQLASACDGLADSFEFLFVDDGSTDATDQVLSDLCQQDARVRCLRLSRNFGHQAAISAGLAHAAGDAVIMMDGDLQHPPELIPLLVERWRDGFDIVNTVRLETAKITRTKRFFSACFYRIFNLLADVRIEPAAADFRLMSRAAVDVLSSMAERHRFLRGLVPWLGFNQTQLEFKAPERWAGRSKFDFKRNIHLALEGITAFSPCPLRWALVAGALTAVGSLGLGLISLGILVWGRASTAGWVAVAAFAGLFESVQLLGLGLLGEYVGRTLEQVKGRPQYIVRGQKGFPSSPSGENVIPAPHFALERDAPGEVRTSKKLRNEATTLRNDPRASS